MTPQAHVVLKHLQEVGSITNVEAHMVHKIRSVSRRITEISDAGYAISKQRRSDATGQKYVRYAYLGKYLGNGGGLLVGNVAVAA
jgi:hypothetical protein